MKLTTALILVTCFHVYAKKGYTQESITLSEKNAKLTTVFKKITDQTGYYFVHRDEWVEKAKKVNVEVVNASLETVMGIVLKDQQLTYTVIGKNVIIKIKDPVEKNASFTLGTPIDVSGKVVNEKEEPLEGVTVTVKGSSKITTTNAKGEFSLNTIEGNAVLVFTSVNMETFEVEISGKTDLTINLKTKVTALGDVTVLNTGYQSLRPNEVTGSFAVVTKEKLDQRVALDIVTKLEGITNGLVFNKDPNSGENKLRVRGESTIFANPNPLIVVDNFPYDGNLNSINPNDIEDIVVLKDAAAASIWGVQAGNGVIVITTKKGRMNQPIKVEFNSNLTISDKPNQFYAPQISPSDYIDFETILFGRGYYNSTLNNIGKPGVSSVVEILNNRRAGLISSTDSANQINALRNYDYRNELDKYIYRKPIHQQYQVNVSGGSPKASYYFSAGYDKMLATLIGNKYDRATINSQNVFRPINKIEIVAGFNYSQATNVSNGISNIVNDYPYTQLVDASGNQLAIPRHRALFEDTIAHHGFINWKYYPLKERDGNDNANRLNEIRLTGAIKYTVLRGLSVELSYQYQKSMTTATSLLSNESFSIRDLKNTFALTNSRGDYLGTNYPDGGINTITNSNLVGQYARANIKYHRTWQKHSINSIGGLEVRETKGDGNTFRYYGFNPEVGSFVIADPFKRYYRPLTKDSAILGVIPPIYSSTINRFRSFFTNVAYTYDGKYSFSASARIDGSNYFGVKTNQKNVPLWSVGTRWEISKESFYQLNYFKVLGLRATYGYNGNLASNMAAVATFKVQGSDPNTGLPYAILNNIPNPELRWEKTGQLNVGLDFVSKNDVIKGTVEYFQKRGKDMIGDTKWDPTTGVGQLRGNFSAMKSKGVDIRIETQNIRTKNLQWNTTFMFNYAAETLTRFDIPSGAVSFLNSYYAIHPLVGKPLYSLFSYRFAGLDPSTGDPLFYQSDTVTKNYTSALANQIEIDDLVYSGRYNPPITGALFNSLRWKKLSLGFNITYKLGHYFRRKSLEYASFVTDWTLGHSDYALRWQKPGDEKTTIVPSFVYPTNQRRDRYYTDSDVLVEKADHIRLQFINLSYDIDGSVLKRGSVKQVRVFFYANNIGIIWRANDKGIDPDYPFINYPTARSYSFGLRAEF
ncbi:MAG: SusC/RagA family TonB-linked outer membrane protein [Chitinophagaceae bacterium]